jgi:hypothetical protein
MNVLNMIAELRAEREQIEHVILTLERIARGGAKRRGRPPKWMSDQTSAEPKRRGRPTGSKLSAAARKAQSERMKKYWAERRKKQR